MRPKMIMLVGVPYSGKTHFARNWLNTDDSKAVYFSFDQKIHELAKERGLDYNTSFKDLFPEAEKIVKSEIYEAYQNKISVVLDMTHLTANSRWRKLCHVPTDYEKICYVFSVPTGEEFIERSRARSEQNVPMSVVMSMIEIFEQPSLEEGFDKIIFVENDVILTP